MTRLFHVYFPSRILVLLFIEALLILCAFLTAIYIRFGSDMDLQLAYEHGVWKLLTAAVVCVLCMHYYDLYGAFVLSGAVQVVARVVQVLGTSCVILSFVYYLYPPLRISLEVAVLWTSLTVTLLVLARQAFSAFNHKMTQKAVLVGNGPLGKALCDEIAARPEFGLRLTGYVGAVPQHGHDNTSLVYLGSNEMLKPVIAKEGITHIVLSAWKYGGELGGEERRELRAHGITIRDGGELYEAISGKVCMATLDADSGEFEIPRHVLLYKRAASIVIAGLGLMLTAPIILLAMLAIRLESSGPAIFRQKRIGKDGKPFTLYKLRTMYDGADPGGKARAAQAKDDRCTKIGKLLRRTRIDELPQMFNILLGDMYFIGPRPFAQNMEEELAETIPFYTRRWAVKPGATGWAQVRRGYCSTLEDNVEKLGYDLFYIKNLSAGLDLLIFFETVKILLLGRGSR